MKKDNKAIYLVPEIEITQIQVERGFEGSNLENPEFDEDI